MNPRIAVFSLVLLSLTACGQAGKLVLPEKKTPPPPKAAEQKPSVVEPMPDTTTPAPAPAPATSEEPKKEQP